MQGCRHNKPLSLTPGPRSILEIERTGVPPPPEMDAYLKSRVDKFYAQLAVGCCFLVSFAA